MHLGFFSNSQESGAYGTIKYMRSALVVVSCFCLLVLGGWFAFTKMAHGNKETTLVFPLAPSAAVQSAYSHLQPSPVPSAPEVIMYRVPITKVTDTTITVKEKQDELILAKDTLSVSKMRNNIVSKTTSDALQTGQRIDLQSTRGKTTVLILL